LWLGLFSYHILVKQVCMGTLEVPVGGCGVV
jgi:hypothetical protein